jgi:hypothetical protein
LTIDSAKDFDIFQLSRVMPNFALFRTASYQQQGNVGQLLHRLKQSFPALFGGKPPNKQRIISRAVIILAGIRDKVRLNHDPVSVETGRYILSSDMIAGRYEDIYVIRPATPQLLKELGHSGQGAVWRRIPVAPV